jgi:histidine triad (HIT) family protein
LSEGCIFCLIVRGEAPTFKVYEDADTLAFMDLFPVAPGHTLVIPKQHGDNIFEVSERDLERVAAVSRRVALAIRSELAPEGLGVFQLNGAAAGQTVFHYHQHLIPRSAGEALTLHTRVRGDDEDLARIARLLAGAL